jgi:2-iminobutanoate/2-iminopropanoate deaminase
MRFIETKDAPLPAGHYSQAVVANDLVFISGILPIVPGKERQMPEGLVAQTKQVLTNLRAILDAAGSHVNHLVSVQIFIPTIESWPVINEIYRDALGAHRPARTVIPCGPLHASPRASS